MISPKLFILFSILFIFIFRPTKDRLISNQRVPQDTLKIESDPFRKKTESSGKEEWDKTYLVRYSRYLNNSEINFADEIKKLESLPPSFERTYLLSLIYKRQGKFKEMFDSLYSNLQTKSQYKRAIDYLPYYDELVFAASASKMLSGLEGKISSLKQKSPLCADYLYSLIYSSQGEYEKAAELLEPWLHKDHSNFLVVYQLSYAYRNLGDYQKALDFLKDFTKLNKNIDDWETVKILMAEGSLQFYSSNYSEAEKLYTKAFSLSKKIDDLQDEARGSVNLGIIADTYGEIGKARGFYTEAINISKKINDIDAEALAYSELGVSYSFSDELIKAKENYLLSYNLYARQGNLLRLALLSDNLGKIYMRMFDYESALKCYQKGIDYSGENKHAMVVNLIGMADVYTNLSNYSKAIQIYREAQNISKEIKEISLDAQIFYGLGALNFGLNRYENALSYFNNSYKLNNNFDPYLSSQVLNQIGFIYIETDSLKNARNYFTKAIELSKKIKDTYSETLSCINLAFLYIKEKDYSKAQEALDWVEKYINGDGFKYLKAQSFLAEGKIFKGKKVFNDAKNYLSKAFNLGSELREFDIQIEADYLLAGLCEDNNLNSEAESYYKSAVSLIEDVSRPLFQNEEIQISYYLSKNEVYNSFAEFYLKQNKFKDAFELIDRSRSRNTMHNLNNLKLRSLVQNDSILSKIYDYNWILHSNIYTAQETEKAKLGLSSLREILVQRNPLIKKYLNVQQDMSLEDIQNMLGNNENILSIYGSGDRVYLFLVKKNGFYHAVVNLSSDSLKKMVTDISPYYSYSSSFSSSFYNQDLFSFNAEAAYNFYNTVLRKIFEKIEPGSKIIISASAELITLPFEFLVSSYSKNESAYDYKGKNFLVLNYNISYAPSAAIFINEYRDNKARENEKVLLVGNPLINNKIKGYAERRGLLEESSSLPREIPLLPLKYSGEEVNEIGTIVKADKILTDKNATETNFKNDAGQNDIIHLSTHSFLFNKQPVIFFSNYYDPDNDGFLELGEIVQLKLKSSLVVLSSCSSGLGVIDESEGILGMTKAFFEAGAKSVVVSLWSVNDKYTSKFMTLFYKNLSKGYDKSEALRQAKIDFIKEYSPNPYYWAAFVLSGNISKLNVESYSNPAPIVMLILLVVLIPTAIIFVRRYNSLKNNK